MALYSSSECNKMLRVLNEEVRVLHDMEHDRKDYTSSVDEAPIVPDYDFMDTQSALDTANHKIQLIRHAINVFNTTYVLPDFGFTIDVALIKLATANQEKQRLSSMRHIPEKVRRSTYTGLVEFVYRNYDAEDVEKKYKETETLVNSLQLAIDYANLTQKFEVDV